MSDDPNFILTRAPVARAAVPNSRAVFPSLEQKMNIWGWVAGRCPPYPAVDRVPALAPVA